MNKAKLLPWVPHVLFGCFFVYTMHQGIVGLIGVGGRDLYLRLAVLANVFIAAYVIYTERIKRSHLIPFFSIVFILTCFEFQGHRPFFTPIVAISFIALLIDSLHKMGILSKMRAKLQTTLTKKNLLEKTLPFVLFGSLFLFCAGALGSFQAFRFGVVATFFPYIAAASFVIMVSSLFEAQNIRRYFYGAAIGGSIPVAFFALLLVFGMFGFIYLFYTHVVPAIILGMIFGAYFMRRNTKAIPIWASLTIMLFVWPIMAVGPTLLLLPLYGYT